MKMGWATIQVPLAILILSSSVIAGEVYTWTDADGNIHITDRAPKDSSQVESVIRYSNSTGTEALPDSTPQQVSVEMLQAEQLKKKLLRLRERKTQLDKIISENQSTIAAAEKDAAYYRKRSGSYARRNEKTIERQLVVLENNLTTYQSDLRYVEEDIVETERFLKAIGQKMKPEN